MSTYQVKLVKREEIAAGTMAFHFSRPPDFSFKPGQAIDLVLSDAPGADPAGTRHTFSLVSAPFEDRLTIATRLRDTTFKHSLQALPDGAPVGFEGPFGSLTLHNNRARPAVLIAGGIGITPFISMLRQAATDRVPRPLVLLYSNRRPEDAAFLAELQQFEQGHPDFRLIATMTKMANSSQPWTGPTGPIDAALLGRVAGELAAPICYLAGPPAMVEAMRLALNAAGVDDDDIRSEEFYGY